MKPGDRVVTQLPLADLWNGAGLITAHRGETLDGDQIRNLLRRGPVHFVVADVGSRLQWVDPARCFEFWKQDVHSHLFDPDRPYLEDYPDQYYYRASRWYLESGEQAVVLEQSH